ncbi:hypothetical protein [Mesorhizobium sp. 1B3]|uniref:hypothetical protein n=1 Tax=Mesorhizobium sp. 1B3 TaxID=3243599 RepID=UPI003D956B7F
MNLPEAQEALLKVRDALVAAWHGEASPSRRSRLRSLVIKIDRELAIIGERMQADPSTRYMPLRGNFVTAVKDLSWVRNMADTFSISPAQSARIVSWVASILRLL